MAPEDVVRVVVVEVGGVDHASVGVGYCVGVQEHVGGVRHVVYQPDHVVF